MKVACQAAALPGTLLTSARWMLVKRNGCRSPAQPRAALYILKNALFPETGSGGGSGAFSATCLGASEQAENSNAMETNVKKRRGRIVQSGWADPSVPR